jgi:hypothetical protein
MKRFHIIGRLGTILAGLAGIVVTLGAVVAPAALAGGDPQRRPGLLLRSQPPGWDKHPPLPVHAHAAVTGGMPGWQIALIVAGAALVAGALAVLAYRARTARQRVTVSAA